MCLANYMHKTLRTIRAARTAREFPEIFPMLADGRLSPSAVLLLTPYLTHENSDELLAAATGKASRDLERLLAERFPRPDVPSLVQAVTDREHATQHVEAAGADSAGTTHAPASTMRVITAFFCMCLFSGASRNSTPVVVEHTEP